jgi:hypothetical protein
MIVLKPAMGGFKELWHMDLCQDCGGSRCVGLLLQ